MLHSAGLAWEGPVWCAGEDSRVCEFTRGGPDGGLRAFAEQFQATVIVPDAGALEGGPSQMWLTGISQCLGGMLALGVSDNKGPGPPQL